MDIKELRDRLTGTSAQLQNLVRSQATISKFVECGKVKVVDTTAKEGEDPAALSVNGSEAIQAMMNPIIRELNSQRERLLNIKEALLNEIERMTVVNSTPDVPVSDGDENPKAPTGPTLVRKEEE